MTIKKARAALSHSVFTGISRSHLDRLVTELAVPFHAGREGRLHRRSGDRDRHRWPGAGHPETLTLRDRLLVTLAGTVALTVGKIESDLSGEVIDPT